MTIIAADSIPDPSQLRKAVRMVHCLQKERGASCAFSVSDSKFEQHMTAARHETDIAVELWHRDMQTTALIMNHESVVQSLTTVRSRVARKCSTMQEENSVGDYHQVLVLYNTIITSVLHSFLLLLTKQASTRGPTERQEQTSSLRKTKSLDAAAASSLSLGQEFATTTTPGGDGQSRNNSPRGVSFARTSRLPELMKVFEWFVKLKESAGLERALLSSMFAIGKVDPRYMNDLVLEVENQRKLITELRSLSNLDGNLLQLIRETVGMSPSMHKLQKFIMSEGDMSGFDEKGWVVDLKTVDVWNLITTYMDKLHSLELLLIEEIESASIAEGLSLSTHFASLKRESVQLRMTMFGENATLANVKDMSPESIKAKVIELLEANEKEPSNHAAEASAPSLTRRESNEKATTALSLHSDLNGIEPTKPEPSEWDINIYELNFRKRIGSGSAGTTYLAKWSGQDVAVKVAAINKMGLEGWRTEITALKKLHHPNIIRLLGSVYSETPLTYCLVLEYCSAGDLCTALVQPTPAVFFTRVATDIANGMQYLHSRGIIHRDIKPANVLVDGDIPSGHFHAKVTDFGVASTDTNFELTAETGTYRWMAPEVLRHVPYSEKADCYSYGLLIWELITREDPFADVSPLEAAGKVALEKARPPFPRDIPPLVQEFIENCWEEEPTKRLSFEEISKWLSCSFHLSDQELKWIQSPLGHQIYSEGHRTNSAFEQDDGVPIIVTETESERTKDKSKEQPKNLVQKLLGGRKLLIRRRSSINL